MQETPEPTTPTPKRYWWLKRLALAALLLIILLGGLRLIWGQRVQAKLDTAIADIHANDEPILFTDLVYPPLMDADNGASYLQQARLNWPGIPNQPGISLFDTDWYNQGEEAGFTDPITDNAAYLVSCQAALDLLRDADNIEQSAWGSGLTRPLFFMNLPHLGESRELARYVDDLARRALEIGDIELVFETMLMQHTIAGHVTGQSPFIIDSLVAISIMSMNREFIEYALPKIDPADLREGRSRELAFEAIARLTDGMQREELIRGFLSERAASYDIYECLIDGTASANSMLGMGDPVEWVIDTPGLSYAYRPALMNAQHTSTQFYTEVIEALRNRENYSDIPIIDPAFAESLYANPLKYPMLAYLLPAYGAAIRTYERSEALLHCAATAIAIKLYEADHGKRPDTLDLLVPDYLPAIPKDPFSKTGEPIRYNPVGITPTVLNPEWLTDEQREQLNQHVRPYPVLYSLGGDDLDQHGGPLYLDYNGSLDDSQRYPSVDDGETGDIWFMLDPWPERIFTDEDLGLEEEPYYFDEF